MHSAREPPSVGLVARAAGWQKARAVEDEESVERPLLDRNMSSSTDLSSLSKSAVAHIPLLIRERRLGESQRSLFSTTSLDRSNDMKGIIADSGSDRFNQIMAVRIIEKLPGSEPGGVAQHLRR